MITRITKENRGKYLRLFEKATKVLKERGFLTDDTYTYVDLDEKNYLAGEYYVEDKSVESGYSISDDPFSEDTKYFVKEDSVISSLQEYFQHIGHLYAAGADNDFIRLPLDEPTFDIDLNTRQINIPDSFKRGGIAVQGDELAETIYFKVDRYFDAVDLAADGMLIIIQWEAPNGKKMASPAYFASLDAEADKIIFGWAITKTMTERAGALKFSVVFIDGEVLNTDDKGAFELNIANLEYRLGTLTASIQVNQGLSVADKNKIVYENKLTQLQNRIKNSPIYSGIIEGEAGEIELLPYLFGEKEFSWVEQEAGKGILYNNIFTDLMDDPETVEVETGIPMLATSKDAGIITYAFFKEGIQSPILGNAGSMRYIKPQTINTKLIEEGVYFIKEGPNSYHLAAPDELMVYVGTEEVINPLLYEKIAFLPLPVGEYPVPGTYYAKVFNRSGNKGRILETPRVIIPGPVAIDKVVIDSDKETFEENSPATVRCEEIKFVEETENQNPQYQWFKRVGEEDIKIEGANESSYVVKETGDYLLKVFNTWNKADTDTVISNNIIGIYEKAITPKILSFVPAEESVLSDKDRPGDIVYVGTKLVLDFESIEQDHAEQTVFWEVSVSTDNDVSEKAWAPVKIKDEEGKEVQATGKEFTPTEVGEYRAYVRNFITKKNQETTYTYKMGQLDAEGNPLDDNDWTNRIIRVVQQ